LSIRRSTCMKLYTYTTLFRSIWKKVKLFDLKDGKLYYENKEVIPIQDVNKVIDSEYNDCQFYGRDKLYYLIKSKYVGISRNDVMNYIANNQTNQLHSRPKLRNLTIKPIIVKRKSKNKTLDTDDFQIVLNEYDDNKGDDFHIYIEQD